MRRQWSLRVFTVLAFAGVLIVLAACSKSKMTMANYEKVATGMSQADVEAILGPGKEQASTSVAVPGASVGGVTVPATDTSARVLTWQDGRKIISVTFVNGKVMTKTQFGL
jgi:hypothetical protein